MNDSRFRVAFTKSVEPVLRDHGFRRIVAPSDWMAPTLLFGRDDMWLGGSWDWRDDYLERDLGRLFAFRDVMPRAIIVGPLKVAANCSRHPETYMSEQLERAADRLPQLLESVDLLVDAAIRARLTPPSDGASKGRRTFAEFATRVGPRLSLADWPGARVG